MTSQSVVPEETIEPLLPSESGTGYGKWNQNFRKFRPELVRSRRLDSWRRAMRTYGTAHRKTRTLAPAQRSSWRLRSVSARRPNHYTGCGAYPFRIVEKSLRTAGVSTSVPGKDLLCTNCSLRSGDPVRYTLSAWECISGGCVVTAQTYQNS